MANLSEMIYGTAQNAAQSQGAGLPEAVAKGAQLAQSAEELQIRRGEFEQKQQQLQNAKYEKLMQIFEASTKMDPRAQKAFLGPGGFMRQVRDQVGMTQMIPDATLDFMTTSEPNYQKARGLLLQAASSGDPKMVASAWTSLQDHSVYGDLGVYMDPLNKEANEMTKTLINARAQQARAGQNVSPEKQLADFGKEVLAQGTGTPTGRAKAMVDTADAILRMTESKVPTGATREQRVEAYNKLTPQQNNEVFRNLDKMLSQGHQSVHGMENLEVHSGADVAAKYGQNIFNFPIGSNQGEFIENVLETVRGERKLNVDKFKSGAQSLKESNTNAAAKYGPKMDKMIDDAVKSPEGLKTLEFKGRKWSADKLQEVIDAHANDPKWATDVNAARKALKAVGK